MGPAVNLDLLGIELCESHPTCRLGAGRFKKLRAALGAMETVQKASGRQFARLLGRRTFAALLRRPALAVFSAADGFATQFGDEPCPLWPSFQRELANFRHILSLIRRALS